MANFEVKNVQKVVLDADFTDNEGTSEIINDGINETIKAVQLMQVSYLKNLSCFFYMYIELCNDAHDKLCDDHISCVNEYIKQAIFGSPREQV